MQERPHILPVDPAFHRRNAAAFFQHAAFQIFAAQAVLQRLEGVQAAGITAAVRSGANPVAVDVFHAGEAELLSFEGKAIVGRNAQALIRVYFQGVWIRRGRNTLIILMAGIDPDRRGRPQRFRVCGEASRWICRLAIHERGDADAGYTKPRDQHDLKQQNENLPNHVTATSKQSTRNRSAFFKTDRTR
ncbi:hypothetical protein AGR1C_Lc50172 [Agrobacterium fabacearum TT111]|nr:hypothetical protein AGR1C_Lc50172 [Agrobacterium fabacearum TT111]